MFARSTNIEDANEPLLHSETETTTTRLTSNGGSSAQAFGGFAPFGDVEESMESSVTLSLNDSEVWQGIE